MAGNARRTLVGGVRGHVWAPQTKVRRPDCLARYVARRPRAPHLRRWALLIALRAVEQLEGEGAVRGGRPGPEGGRQQRGLRHFLPRGARGLGVPGVHVEAVRALRGARNGDCDQLTVLPRDLAVVAAHDRVQLDEALELR